MPHIGWIYLIGIGLDFVIIGTCSSAKEEKTELENWQLLIQKTRKMMDVSAVRYCKIFAYNIYKKNRKQNKM